MSEQALSLNTAQSKRAILHPSAFAYAGASLSILMLAGSLDFGRSFTLLETLQCACVFAAMALVAIAFGGPMRMAGRPAARIALAVFFAAAIAAVNPVFRYSTFDSTLSLVRVLGQRTLYFPCLMGVLLWFFSLGSLDAPQAPCGSASRLEHFLRSPANRVHLAVVALLIFAALSILTGLPLRSSLGPIAIGAVLLLALNALLKLASVPLGASVLCGGALAATAWMGTKGMLPYLELRRDASRALELMHSNPDEAKKAYERAVKLSADLHTIGPRIQLESAIARNFEAQNNPPAALTHWERVAALLKADRETFAPIQRVRCEMGFSLPVWRRLVYEGFPAIDNPEMAPGVMRLGEIAPDVRSKLLAALLAWNREAPEAERRRLLEAVQKAAPGEPSSLNLLNRLGVPFPATPMLLSPELIVGSTISLHGELGMIEDLGETSTVVCLNAGHWEMSLRAAGTPMHEEWPIVRVELNGRALATTQVNKAVEYDVPFTFDVTRDDIFRLRIVFLNHREDLEEGHTAHRGLTISGIKFSRAKD